MTYGNAVRQVSRPELSDIPTGYLQWLLTRELWSDLREAVEEEIELRKGGFTRQQKQPPATAVDVAGWYRKLSLQFHPDRGGTKEQMQAINRAKELLEQMLR